MSAQQLHLAYSAQGDNGINRDVNLFLDSVEVEADGDSMFTVVLPRIEAFLKATGLIGPNEVLDTTIQ